VCFPSCNNGSDALRIAEVMPNARAAGSRLREYAPSRSRSMKTAIAHWHGTADANRSRTLATCGTLFMVTNIKGSDEQRPSAAMFLINLQETHISDVGI
jgi:hypothetical protein